VFCRNIHLIKFITLFLGSFDSKSRRLEYCNAGHNPPLWRRSDGKIQWLQPTGAAVGLAESFSFNLETVHLSPGDILVLYTDGVTEAMNAAREEFGENRLAELVRRKADSNPKEMIKELRLALQEFTGGRAFDDDVTIVVGRVER
jgi:sigma-B regulation protein RsbU (phosphoserine phosphatase)